jgi:hypothetical protein
MAHHFAKAALAQRDINSDAWQAYGLVLEAMGCSEEAMEALLTSLECQQHCPLRPYCSVLM